MTDAVVFRAAITEANRNTARLQVSLNLALAEIARKDQFVRSFATEYSLGTLGRRGDDLNLTDLAKPRRPR